jgi:hypothetical protein
MDHRAPDRGRQGAKARGYSALTQYPTAMMDELGIWRAAEQMRKLCGADASIDGDPRGQANGPRRHWRLRHAEAGCCCAQ